MTPWVAGIDLGGTKIEIGLVAPDNSIVARRRFPTEDARGPASVVERIAACIEALQAQAGARVAAVGVCTPGPVDHLNGVLHDPPNIPGLHHAPLAALLSERLGVPARLEHDAKATGLGEYHFGAGRGERSMVYIIVGTGVGAAIIADGEIYRGAHNSAGEFGHTTLDRYGAVCSCGSRGCVETFMSGPWLARRYAAAQQGGAPTLETEARIDGEAIAALAGQGDPLALHILSEAGDALGTAIATLAMILDIECYVIGGSVAHCGELFFAPARQAVPRHSFRSVGERVRIVGNQLDTDAAILGCAWLARQALGR
ncbi:MAG TPA: ROK family protein [Caldilinea sp.]|nr:ROK family protein [Caldilinea sp.]